MKSQLIDRAPAHDSGHGGFPFDAGSGPNPRCHWNLSVCTQTPTHYVEWGRSDPTVATYCVRHYVLELSRLLDLDLPTCRASLYDHLGKFGPIVEPR